MNLNQYKNPSDNENLSKEKDLMTNDPDFGWNKQERERKGLDRQSVKREESKTPDKGKDNQS